MNDEAPAIRALEAADLDRVVALDRMHEGQSRRGFFTKRFAAMAARGDDFVALGAESGGTLIGFVIARMFAGEFGMDAPLASLDAIAVEPGDTGHGVGMGLLEALEAEARRRGAAEIRTQIDWRQPGLAGFFSAAGFQLAPEIVLERDTGGAVF